MRNYLKCYGVVSTPYDARDTGISGSSKFSNIPDFFCKGLSLKPAPRAAAVIEKPGEGDVSEGRRSYGVNYRKLKDKIYAYAALRKSAVFLAFYSISFPKSIPDSVAYRILNSLLTSLRTSLGLKSYIWVMERQKNGTVHYHLLTNDYMNVREVNRLTAVAIQNAVDKGECGWGRSSLTKYNGVDVKAICKKGTERNPISRKAMVDRVARYISKYVSKDLKCSEHRVWHCSRLVSALFVSCYMSDEEVCFFFECDNQVLKRMKVVECLHGKFYFFAAITTSWWADTVGKWNEAVYQWFEDNGCW